MCGICGIINYGNVNATFDESLLVKMSDSIRHRGPDDSGTFISPDKRVGFGFRRLSIVDLSPTGHQPMHSPDGKITIIFNGEIYNHLVLRREFEAKGYRYKSRSDTETIIYAYQEYGLDFVHKLLGMFALAIWDESRKRLVLARDRIGIKPLYYTISGGNFIFGSEIKALLQHPAVHRELNQEAMNHYLTFMISPAPMTMFKDVYKLEPGHILTVAADGRTQNRLFWEPVPERAQPSIGFDGTPVSQSELVTETYPMTEDSCVQTIRTLLKQSIKDRMMSDVPFGVFLSGGVDSSTNVALMAELMDKPVDTFSVGFRDLEKYNELHYARQIAKEFKTNHYEVLIGQKEAFEFLPKLIHHLDEPLADQVCIPLYFVSKLARENGTIVVQVGEGSDEQFAGYPSMTRELSYYNTVWKLPKIAQSAMYHTSAGFLKARRKYLPLDYLRKAAEGDELFWGGAINFTETHKRLLCNGKGRDQSATGSLARQWHQDLLRRDPGADYLKRMIYLEFRHRLPELLLMRVDKMSMATSVEARVPFLDHRLVEFSMRIPASLKIRNRESKYILKKAVEGIIPHNIIHRKKQGFDAPVSEWLRSDWSTFAKSKLMNSQLMRQNFFRKDFVSELIQENQTGSRQAGKNMWNLLNLTLWHEAWIEGKSL